MTPASERRYDLLEHTADVGLRARGSRLEDVFEAAAEGLADILGRLAKAPSPPLGSDQRVALASSDLEALLVDWLNEVLFRLEQADGCLGEVRVEAVAAEGTGEAAIDARLGVVACPEPPEGTEIKAATYHQLSVRPAEDGYEATVFFDV